MAPNVGSPEDEVAYQQVTSGPLKTWMNKFIDVLKDDPRASQPVVMQKILDNIFRTVQSIESRPGGAQRSINKVRQNVF